MFFISFFIWTPNNLFSNFYSRKKWIYTGIKSTKTYITCMSCTFSNIFPQKTGVPSSYKFMHAASQGTWKTKMTLHLAPSSWRVSLGLWVGSGRACFCLPLMSLMCTWGAPVALHQYLSCTSAWVAPAHELHQHLSCTSAWFAQAFELHQLPCTSAWVAPVALHQRFSCTNCLAPAQELHQSLSCTSA